MTIIKQPIEQLLRSGKRRSSYLRTRLVSEGLLDEHCQICGLGTEWQGKPITLQLDHINGDGKDNSLINLRLLCPNCHTQTSTWGGRNAKNRESHKEYTCPCGAIITRNALECRSCSSTRTAKKKISWPDCTELLAQLAFRSYRDLARELGVSDTAIKAHLIRHGHVPVKKHCR